jgi:hypothetical protein
MKFNNLTDIIKNEETDLNPFSLLGLEPWLIKSMQHSEIKSYLTKHKKNIAQFFHPDKFANDSDKIYYGHFFRKVVSAIDSLLEDEFYFRKSLDDFKDDNQIQLLNQRLNQIKQENTDLKNKEVKLSNIITKSSQNYNESKQDILEIFTKIKETQLALIPTDKTISITDPNNQSISFINNHIKNEYIDEIKNLLSDQKRNGIDLEISCRQIILDYISEYHNLAPEDKKKEKENFLPVFEGKVIGDKIQINSQKTNHKYEDLEIIGGFTYQALRGFYDFNPKLKGGEKKENTININEFKSNFHITTQSNSELEKKYLTNITPFLSEYIFPFSLAIVKIQTKDKLINYRVIFPIMLEKYKSLYNNLQQGNN